MYLYSINYPVNEEQLCNLEMTYLFGFVPESKIFTTPLKIDADRSPFVKFSIEIMETADTIEELVKILEKQNLFYENYKVKFIDFNDETEFNRRHEIEGIVGYTILGNVDMYNPSVVFSVCNYKGKWIFGKYTKNKGIWRIHEKKPYYFCNALSTRLARVLVNVAIKNNKNTSLVDPCCGIGTVVCEAVSMGLNIKGYDFNANLIENAKKNLEYFGYGDVIETGSIHEIDGKFDAAILDIPYGILSITSEEEQRKIMFSAGRIADRIILVSTNEMDEGIASMGFEIENKCEITKMKFKRYITVCKKIV